MTESREHARPLRDFGIRTASAIIMGAIVLVALLFGRELGLAVVFSLIGALAVGEFYALTRRERRLPNEVFGVAACVALPLLAATHGLPGMTALVSALVIASLGWHLVFRQVRLSDTAVTVFGVVYVGFTLAHIVLIRALDSGTLLVLATIVSVWVNDVFAYLIGSSIGRRLLAPRISPKKTWEGFAAGTLATVGVWIGVYHLADTTLSLESLVAVGLAASVAAAVGDLAESRIKREVGAKDSGRGLPGHGGFLDRFDSLILVSIVTYYMLILAGAQGAS